VGYTYKKWGGSASHPPAFFCAVAACLRAPFAVVNVVPLALLSTSVAGIGTQPAKLLCKLAIHRHQRRRCPADGCTLSVYL